MEVTWPFDPTVYAGLVLLLLGYAWLARDRLDSDFRPIYFLAGVGVLWVALESPIDTVGDHYLQSVHMFQHVLLATVAPPLLALGLSPRMAEALLRPLRALRFAVEPVAAQLIAAVVMIAWHLPVLYNLTNRYESVHVVEHLMFIGAGVIVWWPLLEGTSATLRTRLGVGAKMVYALLATLAMDGIAIVLQFSRTLFYPAYAHTPAIAPGYTAVIDQSVAGAVLQLAGKVSFAVFLLLALYRWMASEGPDGDEAELTSSSTSA